MEELRRFAGLDADGKAGIRSVLNLVDKQFLQSVCLKSLMCRTAWLSSLVDVQQQHAFDGSLLG